MERNMKPIANGKEAKYLCSTCGFLPGDADNHNSDHVIIKMIPCMSLYYGLYIEHMKLAMQAKLYLLIRQQLNDYIETIETTISKQQRTIMQAIKTLIDNNKNAMTLQNIELLVKNCKSEHKLIEKNVTKESVMSLKQQLDDLLDCLSDKKNAEKNNKGVNKCNEIKYPNAKYIGATLDGKRDGIGTLTSNNGEMYKGEWKNDVKEGKGVYKYKTGNIYDGEWKNDAREGKGVLKHYDGSIYDGEWKNDVYEGKGEYKFKSGNTYDGEWKNGVKEGRGVLKYNDGNIYDGKWKNDAYEGKGEYKYKSGNLYDGEWS